MQTAFLRQAFENFIKTALKCYILAKSFGRWFIDGLKQEEAVTSHQPNTGYWPRWTRPVALNIFFFGDLRVLASPVAVPVQASSSRTYDRVLGGKSKVNIEGRRETKLHCLPWVQSLTLEHPSHLNTRFDLLVFAKSRLCIIKSRKPVYIYLQTQLSFPRPFFRTTLLLMLSRDVF